MKRLIVVAGRAALAVLACAALAWGWVLVAIVRAGARDDAAGLAPGSTDAIVVLGAAQYDGRPSPVLRMRLDHAIALWRRRLAPTLVLTGGRGAGDTTSEAAVERRYAAHAGIADSALLMEAEGRSTRESLAGVAALARQHGLRRLVVVSDPTHVYRVAVLARQEGFEAITSPWRPVALRRDWRGVLAESVKVPVAWVSRLAD
ncbi:MAG: YdcF family protein [Gemmatimonadetes bacterium]|nr:YdcF family protein [Gemmatimonadota bacterium]